VEQDRQHWQSTTRIVSNSPLVHWYLKLIRFS